LDLFFFVLLGMFGLLYFTLIRPQRQEQRRLSDTLQKLKVGDEVVTGGGIYGEIVELDEERVLLEVDDDVRIAVARRAIAAIVPPEELARLEGDGTPVTAEEPLTAEERVEKQAST
jgi:preprotein translocase subunit YajC